MLHIWMKFNNRGKGFYLPDQQNWAGQIALDQADTNWSRRVVFQARVLEGQWFLGLPMGGYKWDDYSGDDERAINDRAHMSLSGKYGKIDVIVSVCEKKETIYKKYAFPINAALVLGRDPQANICMTHPFTSSKHGMIKRVNPVTCTYTDISENGTYINGALIKGRSQQLSFGDKIEVLDGLSIRFLNDVLAINQPGFLDAVTGIQECDVTQSHNETAPVNNAQQSVYIEYHRSPRRFQKANEETLEIEAPLPKTVDKETPILLQIGPSLTMILPMLMMTLVMDRAAAGLVMVGTSAVLAVSWGVLNRKHRRKQNAVDEETRIAMCRQYYDEVEATLLAETERERARLTYNFLSVQQCADLPQAKSNRLWERMPSHGDFLAMRLGLGELRLPRPVQYPKDKLSLIEDPLRHEPKRLYDTYSMLQDVPIRINSGKNPVIGVLGNQKKPWMMQSLVLQAAANHSYHDVRIAIIHKPEESNHWKWAKWLPHVFSSDDRNLRMVVSEQSSIHTVFSYLDSILSIRADSAAEAENEAGEDSANDSIVYTGQLPYFLIFVTDPSLISNQPIMRYMSSSNLGFSLIVQSENLGMLPKESKLIIEANNQLGSVYSAQGDVMGVRYDDITEAQLQGFARSIAPYRENDAGESSAIPTYVTFMDVYNARSVDELDIWRYWNENLPYEGIKSYIGLRAGAQPFALDVSDKYHGPHGLIAGTTGAGKSVLLQSYILSLAINYNPTEVQFILIDYKGGGTSDSFRGLPHVAGVIDNLQGESAIFRALASLNGEIKRRLAIFKDVGVNNIDDYMKLFNQDPDETPLSHMIIIVDEFAELKQEQPEFMHELVSAARVGRSLGFHLILATQKPSNSVSDEIAANTRFRICLRVASKSDSSEMLHRPDAAYLKGMGRCFVQVGNDEIFEQVQTSFSGAEYNPQALRPEEEPRMLNEAGQPIIIKKKKSAKDRSIKKFTELDAVMARIAEVMALHKVSPAKRLWLDELAKLVMLETIPEVSRLMYEGGVWPASVDHPTDIKAYYAMADNVTLQTYEQVAIDFTNNKNHMLVGLSGTGKTVALQTIAVSLALTYTPDQLNIYVFSLTSRVLSCLGDLPHVGDIVFEDELDEQIMLINMLKKEDDRRRELFAKLSTDSFVQYNKAVSASSGKYQTEPAIVVLVDRMEQLRDWEMQKKGIELQTFYDLLREATSRGIYFVLTGISKNELPMKYHSYISGVALHLADRGDYADVINTRMSELVNINECAGRGMYKDDNGVLEMQIALYKTAESDALRADLIRELGLDMTSHWHGRLPMAVPRIPEHPTLAALLEHPSAMAMMRAKTQLPIGYSKDTTLPAMVDLSTYWSFLILGDIKSGKTNMVKFLADVFHRKGADVYLIGGETLRAWGKGENMKVYAHRDTRWHEDYIEINNLLKTRSEAKADLDEVERKPIAVLLDDIEVFIDQNTKWDGSADMFRRMSDWIVHAQGLGVHVIASTSVKGMKNQSSSSIVRSFIAEKRAFLLQGVFGDGNPFGIMLPFGQKEQQMPIGEGILLDKREMSNMAFPLASDDDGRFGE